MPLFHYHAFDGTGRKQKGLLEATCEREARERLRSQGLMVRSLEPKRTVSSRENLRGEMLVTFTLQLSQLVNAGVPLYEGLLAIEEQFREEPFHRVLLSLCEEIKGGKRLSEAMSTYPGSFNALYTAMVAAGEASGSLDTILEKLAELLQRQAKTQKEVMTALLYPAVLSGFSLIVIAVLLGFVVPSLEGLFADRRVNDFTAFVLGWSRLMRNYAWVYLPLGAALVGAAVWQLRTPEGKRLAQTLSLRLPLLRTLIIQNALSRFCRTLGTLLKGGVNMIDALKLSRGVLNQAVLEEEIARATEKVIEGCPLSAELGRSTHIPKLISRMLAIGEETGSSPTMLQKIAELQEMELEKTRASLLALSQPLILITLGAVIGLIMMAILLPLTDMAILAPI